MQNLVIFEGGSFHTDPLAGNNIKIYKDMYIPMRLTLSHSRRVRGGPQVAPPVVLGLIQEKK